MLHQIHLEVPLGPSAEPSCYFEHLVWILAFTAVPLVLFVLAIVVVKICFLLVLKLILALLRYFS